MKQKAYTLLAVHAHPDDESSGTGGLLRLAANHGCTTVLVTCTNGDLGETRGPARYLSPQHKAADRQQLAVLRRTELETAAGILGITHLYCLDYHDSGMHGWESNQDSRVFARVEVHTAAARLVHILRQHRPDVVVTYDENGGYGHPDHIMAHRITIAALAMAADPCCLPESGAAWRVRKLYYTAWARSDMLRAFRVMHWLGWKTPLRDPNFDASKFGCPDELITTRIDVRAVMPAKWRALFAHRTQMGTYNAFWCFLRLTGRWLYPCESFRCVTSEQPVQLPEHDLFAGLS